MPLLLWPKAGLLQAPICQRLSSLRALKVSSLLTLQIVEKTLFVTMHTAADIYRAYQRCQTESTLRSPWPNRQKLHLTDGPTHQTSHKSLPIAKPWTNWP